MIEPDSKSSVVTAEQVLVFFEGLNEKAKREYLALVELDRRYGEDVELEAAQVSAEQRGSEPAK